MGQAPKIVEELLQTQAEAHAEDRKWFLNTETGQLTPEEEPGERPQAAPAPIQVARQTFD